MENVPECEIIFLNELHEKLKRIDPRLGSNAGLYRILGRLINYDLERQIAKVESCFHHEYTLDPPTKPSTAHKPEHPSKGSAAFQNGTIDLTLDDDDDDDDDDEKDSGRSQDRHGSCIDLTFTTDEDSSEDEGIENDSRDKGKGTATADYQQWIPSEPLQPHQEQNSGVRGLRGPRIVLWIDTQLLDPWRYEPGALFQFIGEVVYEAGHWMLQARTCRNMEGLDLYRYRQSILLMRRLVDQDHARRRNPK
ncbi:hypothetical protein BC939DRAFT_501382 [Gamsiella multidivaricata]|uniref:uncharacterized protein n=1 Tax=Gamsiella multidivaricata TaxID=101098 RepID=UPI0022209519|nr:uncharacterized protein BC939DRAFT_501382 [Gamsiella multidivaricata]KAI7827042.1 hypothetical protein BC939DRAFT_501382 [Gamsiella multidivaricata]